MHVCAPATGRPSGSIRSHRSAYTENLPALVGTVDGPEVHDAPFAGGDRLLVEPGVEGDAHLGGVDERQVVELNRG